MADSYEKLFYDLLKKWETAEEQLNSEFGFIDSETHDLKKKKKEFIARFKKLYKTNS